ncbi:MAG: MerR family transcriptional regulator [Planctomycetes bacterium]|nr:MerR family transcriptional regulator [Planctomycetota bacterium]
MPEVRYNIGQLAKTACVPTTTVRFYESKRLIVPVGRTMSNYRWYDQSSLERLRFIKLAHNGGFSLNDIRAMLEPHDGSLSQCRRVAELITHRLAKVTTQIKELQRLEKVLGRELALCRAGKSPRCAVVDEWQSAAKQ